jgi:hypothetical protein
MASFAEQFILFIQTPLNRRGMLGMVSTIAKNLNMASLDSALAIDAPGAFEPHC